MNITNRVIHLMDLPDLVKKLPGPKRTPEIYEYNNWRKSLLKAVKDTSDVKLVSR